MRLRESRIPSAERDRRAILAMAGPYRVSFDFLEVVRFDLALKQDAPYQSWATEYVFVAEDRPDFIALQHILAMRILQTDGKASDPIVVRHWRQEWRYQAERLLAYQGMNTWAPREVPAEERKGAWVQSVYQVDDSPRYAARGRWEHTDGMSTWISDETWRPLPRREFSVRKDYDVLVGTNRHTITAGGWVQEENNLKLATADGRYLSREYGVARYERIRDSEFAAADRYYDRTREFWSRVRGAWSGAFAQQGTVTLRGPVDKLGLFAPLFARADEIESKGSAAGDNESLIRSVLAEMGALH
jgi:hypothetical protein